MTHSDSDELLCWLEDRYEHLRMLDDLPAALAPFGLTVDEVLEGIRDVDTFEASSHLRRVSPGSARVTPSVRSAQARRVVGSWYAHGLSVEQIDILCGPSLNRDEIESYLADRQAKHAIDERELRRLHHIGRSIPEIAREMQLHKSTVQTYLERNDLAPNLRKPRVPQALRTKVITLRNDGKTYDEIQKATGLNLTQVKSVLRYAAKAGMVRGYGQPKAVAA